MDKPSFDAIFLDLAVKIAQRSHCIKKRVGAVLAKDTRVISTGYNGPPSNALHCDEVWPTQGCPRDARGSCSLALHAEQNAILYALRQQTLIRDSTLYATLSPCLPCARIILSVGITRVVYVSSYAHYKQLSNDEGISFLKRFGVSVEQQASTTPF